jgi:hypothetical protein
MSAPTSRLSGQAHRDCADNGYGCTVNGGDGMGMGRDRMGWEGLEEPCALATTALQKPSHFAASAHSAGSLTTRGLSRIQALGRRCGSRLINGCAAWADRRIADGGSSTHPFEEGYTSNACSVFLSLLLLSSAASGGRRAQASRIERGV